MSLAKGAGVSKGLTAGRPRLPPLRPAAGWR